MIIKKHKQLENIFNNGIRSKIEFHLKVGYTLRNFLSDNLSLHTYDSFWQRISIFLINKMEEEYKNG